MSDLLFATEKALGFESFEDFFATFGGSEACIIWTGRRKHLAVLADDLDALEIMTLADFEIIEIVSWGNFDGASAISGVGVFVGDNRNGAVGQRKLDEAANQILVALVGWVDGDSGVTKESFGASGRDDDFRVLDVGVIFGAAVGGSADFVGDIPEVAVFIFVFDFDVGEGGLVVRAEVDEFFAAVNHAVVPHFLEGFVDAGDDVFIKSKS